jgi:hypothetical protein
VYELRAIRHVAYPPKQLTSLELESLFNTERIQKELPHAAECIVSSVDCGASAHGIDGSPDGKPPMRSLHVPWDW